MSELPTYYVTQTLEPDRIRTALLALPSFLKNEIPAGSVITAVYGWGSQLHPSACHHDMEVGIGWLDKFTQNSLRQEIVLPGSSDFTLSLPDNRMTIIFCHEGDIHTGGDDSALQKRLWTSKPFAEFPFAWVEGIRLLN